MTDADEVIRQLDDVLTQITADLRARAQAAERVVAAARRVAAPGFDIADNAALQDAIAAYDEQAADA